MAANEAPVFGSDEVLWFDNGRWGRAGYAIPNPAGKTWTNNPAIYELHCLIGRSMFELMHRQSVRFSEAPHKQFWFDLHQLIITGRKRLADEAVKPNDNNKFEPKHTNPVPRTWLVYPLPFFGERIRQADIRRYCEVGLLLLSEIMQHSDNEKVAYFTDIFAADCGIFLQEILAKMSMKYFGKTREIVYAPNFALVDADFTNYNPATFMLNVELTDERPPLQWWPTENDLSDVRGIPVNDALVFAKRWPQTAWYNSADGNVNVNTGGQNPDMSPASNAAPVSGFVTQPGLAP